MVPVGDLHEHDLIPLFVLPAAARSEPGASFEGRTAIIRRKENRMSFAANHERLVKTEDQDFEGRIYPFQFAINFGFDIHIGSALEPFANTLPSGWHNEI